MNGRNPHGLRPVDSVSEEYDWVCFCGYCCSNSPDPENVWNAHVAGLALSAPDIDRGESQYLTLDCGCVQLKPWPDFWLVSQISGTVVRCEEHGVGCCFHADVGVDGLPYFRRSECPVVDAVEKE